MTDPMAAGTDGAGGIGGAVTARPRYLGPVRLLALVIALVMAGNVAILAAHLWLQRTTREATVSLPVDNFAVVDDHVWRGAAPANGAYRALAENGVVTVVDLRAEDGIVVDEAALEGLGIRRVHLPLRDGQAPTADQVERFLEVVRTSPGRVYVHCGAGVGRTGVMAAAYLVTTGRATTGEALRRNLTVGPPSLEQVAFAARLQPGEVRRPPVAVVAVSRTLDAPRRLWVHVRRAYT